MEYKFKTFAERDSENELKLGLKRIEDDHIFTVKLLFKISAGALLATSVFYGLALMPLVLVGATAAIIPAILGSVLGATIAIPKIFSSWKDTKLDDEDNTNDKPTSNKPVFKPVLETSFKPALETSQGLKATATPTPQNKPESKPELKFDGVYVKQELKPELNDGVYEPKNGTHSPTTSRRY